MAFRDRRRRIIPRLLGCLSVLLLVGFLFGGVTAKPALAAPSCGVLAPGAAAEAANAVTATCTQLGVNYSWGGGHGGTPGPTLGLCDPANGAPNDCHVTGFDCSGLVRYGYYRALGFDILGSGSTRSQWASGAVKQRIYNYDQLLPGDLLYYSSNGAASGIHHVAMYLGQSWIVEAPFSGAKVRVVTLSTHNDFLGAARLFPASTDEIAGAAAYRWGDQQLVFTPSSTGSLHHWYWIPGEGTEDDDWGGGTIVGKTTGFAYGDQEHVFARGPDNTLLHWWWTAGDGELHYADWHGEAYSDPTAFVWGGQQHIFAKAADGNLFHWYWDPGTGQVTTVKWSGAPAAFVGNPSAFSLNNQQHVVARGPNNELYHWWWDQATGQVTFADWHGEAYSDPTAFVWGGQQHIFAKAADGNLFHWYWDPGTGQVTTVKWSGAPAAFVGAPFGYRFGNQQHVVARGPNNELYHWWWDQATGQVTFADWHGEAYSDPIAFVYDDQQQIFTQSATHTLYHYSWTPQDGLQTDDWGGDVEYPGES
jgi:cell wall-associated NlpC family hydrolase